MTKLTKVNTRVNDIELANEIISKMNATYFEQAARIAALEEGKAKLIEVLDKIRMIASCAPHDDEELASQEFTTIMNEARRVLAEVTK